ncbi:MAG: DUF1127 domain-containing protein [Mesorhizobium sp.]|jgi:uncharacterized protein DUF1127
MARLSFPFFGLGRRRRRAMDELGRLSDRDLDDIGIRRNDIAKIVDREVGRLGLDEFRSR